jgi:hypothetical protein
MWVAVREMWAIVAIAGSSVCCAAPPTHPRAVDVRESCRTNCQEFADVCSLVGGSSMLDECEIRYKSICLDDCKLTSGSNERCSACIEKATKECRNNGSRRLALCEQQKGTCESRCNRDKDSAHIQGQGSSRCPP